MENRWTVRPMSRTLVPFLLFVIAALLAANLWLGGRPVQAGDDDSGAGAFGLYHEVYACRAQSSSTLTLTLVHTGRTNLATGETDFVNPPPIATPCKANENSILVLVGHRAAAHP